MFASWTNPSNSAGVGRVALDAEGPQLHVPGFGYKKTAKNFEKDLLRGNWESTPVSQAFFSEENVKTLQTAIRKSVYDKSGSKKYVIDDQSVDELLVIMRAYFLQYAKNLPNDISGQVSQLNNYVIDWSSRNILAAVQGYFGYIKDITNMPTQMDRPVLMTNTGTRSLPFNNFV